jgi:MYXO-CTERM domain-containing protein
VHNFTQKHWVTRVVNYSALAAAGLLAEPATAGVVYSSSVGFTPITVTGGQTKTVTFQKPGGTSIGAPFQVAAVATGSIFSFVLQNGPACTNKCELVSYSGGNPLRLGGGYLIGPGVFPKYPLPPPYSWVAVNPWVQATSSTWNDIAGDTGAWNQYGTPVRGFLPIRFTSSLLSAGDHYGYFDVSYDPTPTMGNGTLTINGWAYETLADTALTTPTPEPASVTCAGLGLLALGSAGIRARRKKAA